MNVMIRDQASERVLLLSFLFAGLYPSGLKQSALPNNIQSSPRCFTTVSRDVTAYLMRERLIEQAPDESEGEQFRLTPKGFDKILPDAKAILKARFLLGLQTVPEAGAVELRTQSEISAALLLFLYHRELTFFEGVAGLLGIPNDQRTEQAIQEFSARGLIQRQDFPRFQEDWYEITLQGREVCELWLSGQPSVAEWPFRALLSANRRHLPEIKTSPVTGLEIRELGSSELESLAFEYARRELKLQNVRHPGGPYDGGADVLGENTGQGGVLLQSKQTSDNSLNLAKVKREFIKLKVPDQIKPWTYILFTNAKDSRRLAEEVCQGASKAGFSQSTVVSRTNLESFFNQRDNQELISRFFPRKALASENGRQLSRRSDWRSDPQVYAIEAILREYFSERGGQLIVEDIEYEGTYPHRSYPDLAPSEWFKASIMGFDETGLLYGSTADGMLYRIPFQTMVLWDEWTRDEIEGLPHLFVAGLDRIEPLNRSYGTSRKGKSSSTSSRRSNSRKT